jgi:hypothetical protein
MSLTAFKEVTEITVVRFADSPLGKLVEGKAFDKPMSDYDEPLGIICENFKHCPVEGNNGHWKGERGNSKWIPDPDYVPPEKCPGNPYSNPDKLSWEEILKKYDIDGITYKDGEPNFGEVSKGDVEIEPFSDVRDDNFDNADRELASQKGYSPEEVDKWRKEHNYTWHECKDMKTMQKVPNEIHANVSHSGGISEIKKRAGEL